MSTPSESSSTVETPPEQPTQPTSTDSTTTTSTSSSSTEAPEPKVLTRAERRAADINASKQFYLQVEQVTKLHTDVVQSFRSGITRSYDYRLGQLQAFQRMMKERENDFAQALYEDLHKNYAGAYMTELGMINHDIAEAMSELKGWMKPQKVATPLVQVKGVSSSQIYPEPLGVALIISPWNYPLSLALQPLVGAISAGCCAVIKPSSMTCKVAHAMATIIPKYLDPRCYAVVEGSHDVTDELLRLKWDMIFFTGSGSVGKRVYRAATEHLTPCILELGGKSPCIVDETANLDITAKRLVMGKFMNCGQTCVAPDYAMVSEKVLPQLVELLKKYIVEFYGPEPQKSEDFVRIIAQRQFERLTGALARDMEKEEAAPPQGEAEGAPSTSDSSSSAAAAEAAPPAAAPFRFLPPALIPKPRNGHRLLYGGKSDPSDLFIEPTLILCDITSTSNFLAEEIFGPVLPIVPIPAENFIQQCISFVTARDKPLACYLFSDSEQAKIAVASRISSGSLAYNECVLQLQVSALPFGGVGESGMGMYHGRFSFEAFSHRKAILDKAKVFDLGSRYPPYTDSKMSLIKKLM